MVQTHRPGVEGDVPGAAARQEGVHQPHEPPRAAGRRLVPDPEPHGTDGGPVRGHRVRVQARHRVAQDQWCKGPLRHLSIPGRDIIEQHARVHPGAGEAPAGQGAQVCPCDARGPGGLSAGQGLLAEHQELRRVVHEPRGERGPAGPRGALPHRSASRLIRAFSYRREAVLDPFCGSGTTLVAASRLGRHGIGYEIIPDIAARAVERLRQEGRGPPGGMRTVGSRS